MIWPLLDAILLQYFFNGIVCSKSKCILFFSSQDFLESLKPQDLFYYFDTISTKSGESDSDIVKWWSQIRSQKVYR